MRLKATVGGVEENKRALYEMRKHLGVLDRPLRKCADVFRSMWAAQFQRGGAYSPIRSWKALRPGTVKTREEQGFGAGPILWRSGRLIQSWTNPSSPAHLQRVGQTSIEFGSILTTPRGGHYLAPIHHYGAAFTRPAIDAGPGKVLRFWGRDGQWVYRRRVKAAYVLIPARPMAGTDGKLPPTEEKLTHSILDDFINEWFIKHPAS